MQKKKLILITGAIALAAILAVILIFCVPWGKEEPAPPPSNEALVSPDAVVGLVCDLQKEDAAQFKSALETACTQRNWRLQALDADGSSGMAIAQAETLIAAKVGAIVVRFNDEPTLQKIVSLAQEAGIPVLTVDRQIDGAAYLGPDWEKADAQAAEYLAQQVQARLGGMDMLIRLEDKENPYPALGQWASVAEGLQAKLPMPDDAYTFQADARGTQQNAQDEITQYFTDYPDREQVVILCQNESYAQAALAAAEEAGKADQCVIVSAGVSHLSGDMLAADGQPGWIANRTIEQEPYGEQAAAMLERLLMGETPTDTFRQPVMINASNKSQYTVQ
ncbi:substrate-binding domain-containing protein [Christensenellaceae bacterium NSJ-44]|uniref:Substrate-binding domain-containing protein n=1 Tax=Luoshenia tenuis TaxID=2763654 RepID=A0A926HLU8_9FIRM|nr:substrate-binding domain-containing protein [Luoshenia tenuis]MBC8528468.1 substrate-binding domain-containing protein [Luoshenia tenuis]